MLSVAQAAADPAGHEDEMVFGEFGQHFLRQDAGGDRADMAARFHAFDHQRIRAGAQQLLGERQCRREADHLGGVLPALDRFDTAFGRNAPGQHHMAHGVLFAHGDEVEELRVHGDEVHAERAVGQLAGFGDFGVEQIGRHRPAGDHAEPAGVRNGRDEIAFGHPAHRPAQNGGFAAEKIATALHQTRSLGVTVHDEIA